MKAMFERAKKLMAQKEAQDDKVKSLIEDFNAAYKTGDDKRCRLIKKRIETISQGVMHDQTIQFRQYSVQEKKQLANLKAKSSQ